MKLSWANRLYLVYVGMLLFGAANTCAQTSGPEQVATQNEPNSVETAPTVVGIRVVAIDGLVFSESPANIPVRVGKPLERRQVSESLRVLYRTGDYADLRAETTPAPGGVLLNFVVRENFFVNQIIIEGLAAPPSDASAAAAMQLTLGQTYRAADVEEALARLRETLHDEGLYAATVNWKTVAHAETHQMDILVHVDSGERARIGALHLTNGTEYRDEELLSRSKMRSGNEVTVARLQRSTERIRKFLGKKGHLSARASVRRGEYDPANHTVPLELEVTEGPLVQVAASGAKISNRDLKRLVPIYQEGGVDADLLEEGKRNIRERLERLGYFDASVAYRTETKEVKAGVKDGKATEERIIYQIQRGERHRLLGIAIQGNHYFDEDLLRSRLQIFKGDYATRPRFSRRLLESDKQSMLNLYHSNGFLEAKIDADPTDDYHGKSGDLFIQFTIQEGRQTRVASLAIEGSKSISQEELFGVAGSLPGQPYSEINVATDRDNILALYFNRGFPGARFRSDSEILSAETKAADSSTLPELKKDNSVDKKTARQYAIEQASPVRLVYHIEEGPQTRVRRVLLTGYNHTRPGVIRREIQVMPNAPLREGEVVESQQRLYNLGVFNRVTIEPQNAVGTDPDKDVVVLLEEAKRYTIAYGGGFEVQRLASTSNPTGGQLQGAPRGIFEISKLNLTGRADSLSFKVRGSTLQGRALLAYSAPNTFANPHYSFQATSYAEKTRDINTFTETRYEGSLQLTNRATPFTSFLYRYTFRKVLVSNLNIPSQEIPLFNQPTLVSQFGVTWFRDSRNNPADATKGTFNSADLSIADTSIGSSASFLRFFFQNSSYHPIKRNFSFARSIRIGTLLPYHETVSLSFPGPTAPPFPIVIPLPERFFAGGGTSLRGFALNQAGPRDAVTGFPVGGQAMLILNQEFRFPMRLPYLGTQLGGALFYDGGNIFSRISRVTLRTSPPVPVFVVAIPGMPINQSNPSSCMSNCGNELNYFSHTIGLGVRYSTPVGPIRVDLGYQLNRPTFAIPCPNVTIPCQQGTRLPRLQIFFNLGSSF
ncbi:MAG: outer membrane protein assembly factor BamA [Candidatus Acidiferrum sp.]